MELILCQKISEKSMKLKWLSMNLKWNATLGFSGRCIETSGNTATVFCCNCCKFLCKACTEDHKQWQEHELVHVGEGKNDGGTASKNLLQNIPHKPVKCEQHCDETLKFFCETCSICSFAEIALYWSMNTIELKLWLKNKKWLYHPLSKLQRMPSASWMMSWTQGGKVMQQVQANQRAAEDVLKLHLKQYTTLFILAKKHFYQKLLKQVWEN